MVVVVAKLVYLSGIKTMYTSNQFKPYRVVVVRLKEATDDNPEADGLRQSRLVRVGGVGGGYLTR